MRHSYIVAAALTLAACAKVQYRTPGPEPLRAPTVVRASFDKTWNAVIDVFARQNTPVQTLEKASGFIVAERAVIPGLQKAEYDFALSLADCGAVFYPQTGRWMEYPPTAAKYNIVVRQQGDQSTVRVTAKFVSVNPFPAPSRMFDPGARECSSKGKYESETEVAIKTGAEAR